MTTRSRSKVVRTVKPGAPGTHKHVRRYGDLLVAVRYRYHAQRQLRSTTVEVIVDERPWRRGIHDRLALDELDSPERVLVKVGYHETRLQTLIRAAGGRWNRTEQAWDVAMITVRRMALEDRIVFKAAPRDRSP